jgi:hypothetical protein
MKLDEMIKEMGRLETSIEEAKHTLDAFKTVAAYLTHRNGSRPPRTVRVVDRKEPEPVEAPAKLPTMADRNYRSGFGDKAIRDAVAGEPLAIGDLGLNAEEVSLVLDRSTFPPMNPADTWTAIQASTTHPDRSFAVKLREAE